MKVNYLPKNRLKRAHVRRIFILLTIFVSGTLVFYFFSSSIVSIASPIWRTENVVAKNLGNGFAYLDSQKALVAENTMLKEKLISLETKLQSLSSSEVQTSVLMELLGRKPKPEMITAAVLTRPPQTPYDIIIIDAGSNESIALGSEVFLPEGPILGTVFEVFPKSAKVKLFSATGEETNTVLERNNVPITLIGNGGGNFKIILPRDVAVEKGDRILSADIHALLLAVVQEISARPTDSFKEVLATSPTNIFAVRFVFVIP